MRDSSRVDVPHVVQWERERLVHGEVTRGSAGFGLEELRTSLLAGQDLTDERDQRLEIVAHREASGRFAGSIQQFTETTRSLPRLKASDVPPGSCRSRRRESAAPWAAARSQTCT